MSLNGDPIQVLLLPPRSPHRPAVQAACDALGLRLGCEEPRGCESLRVLDLDAGAPEPGPLDLAISTRPGAAPQAFDELLPDELPRRLQRSLRNLIALLRARQGERLAGETIGLLNEIGFAFSDFRDREQLLHRILHTARKVVRADSGTLYLVRGDRLHFEVAQNDTTHFASEAHTLPLDTSSMAGAAAVRGEVIRVEDVYQLPEDAPYTFNPAFDRLTGYRTRSILLVPLRNRKGRVIGVLSLFNRKARAGEPIRDFSEVLPFTETDTALARSIAGQAAVAVENFQLYEEIRALFEGFVTAAVSAIEARDPTTGGHSKRVADLTLALAEAVNARREGPFAEVHFSPEELRELRYAAILHDFGKVDVREQVLLKSEKLHPWELREVEARFRLAALQLLQERGRSREVLLRSLDRLKEDLAFVRRVNRPGPMSEQDRERLQRIARSWIAADDGEPVLGERELARLSIPSGNLDEAERAEMRRHVEYTYHFLSRIPWTRDVQRVPELAAAHHEALDGSGYPRGLKGDEIPLGARLMAIADVFDAVTARDRPYRSALSLQAAVELLRREAAAGRLDADAVELFVEERLWERAGYSSTEGEAGGSGALGSGSSNS